ncbi:hypothetical protein F2Q70_00038325 [Brassica cretica]|uniref:Uncharacterized protein n=1 Tax=Brassica cretica TaxID=69181 RepID=A0A8S9KCR4_BRACR|nr:hypothetical protein F2Q70_00038325 [Brassica cretica]
MGTLGRVIYTVGNWIRGSGQALDRVGSILQGSHRLEEHRDVNNISVGSGTNIQDNSLVHVAKTNLSGKVLPTTIGDNVTVGKRVGPVLPCPIHRPQFNNNPNSPQGLPVRNIQ